MDYDQIDNQHLTEVEYLLEKWGKWKKFDNENGQGYPRQSAEQAANTIRASRNRPLPEWEEEMKIESIISQMPEWKIKKVLVYEYTSLDTPELKAKNLRMSKRTFYDYLRMAKYYVLGKLHVSP